MARGKSVVLTGVTLVQETLSALGVPGAAILEKVVNAAYDRRLRAARDILIETIRREGVENLEFTEDDADDLIQMMMRFAKAAQEGAARQNLKLLAETIVGLKKNRDFKFDKFQVCANVLETMTIDEILFVGLMYEYHRARADSDQAVSCSRATILRSRQRRPAPSGSPPIQCVRIPL